MKEEKNGTFERYRHAKSKLECLFFYRTDEAL